MKHLISIRAARRGLEGSALSPLLRRCVRETLALENVTVPCEVNILYTNDEGIRQLNSERRGIDAPTDVLSFPMFALSPGAFQAEEADPETGLLPLGDIAISLPQARRQAEEFGHDILREAAYLTVHSVLHLLGYDHMEEGERRRMRAREKVVMRTLGMEACMEITKNAMIAITGRPNVGKSTLLNTLVGEKVAIVTPKPQTTRTRICGVLARGDTQFVFLDTPGLHRPRSRLGDYMVKVARESVTDVDAVMLLVEPLPTVGEAEREIIGRARESGTPTVLVINKIDTVKKESLLGVIDAYRAEMEFSAIVPISARGNEGTEELLRVLSGFAQEGPQLFPDGMMTDQPERQVLAEMVREKLLLSLQQEVPHGTAVEVTKLSEREDGVTDVGVTIFCERPSHKGMIIGKQGALLKEIGSAARRDMERFLGGKVYLETWVKVRENWRDNQNQIRGLGFLE